MRTVLVYLHVVGRSDENAPDPIYYVPFQQRFLATYKQFKPTVPHELVVCCCGADNRAAIPVEVENSYNGLNPIFANYGGRGWDIGAFQHVVQLLHVDFAVFLATPVYFWRADWLQKMVDAFNQYGDGLYGPMASYEHAPHIRTSCFGCSPALFRLYPYKIDSRDKARFFESTDWNFSTWVREECGLPVKMVTADGSYDEPEWRKPDNIFRRGDQSNTLIRDRHCDLYNLASPEEKLQLANAADGK